MLCKCRNDGVEELAILGAGVEPMVTAAALADPVDVAEFRVKLDTYDEATVKALMENRALLDSVNQRIEEMLDGAHKLEDGRRVFKTIDGQRVFDEHGASVPLQTINPEQIPNHLPKWEHLQAERQLKETLIEERQQILEFQDKLDRARESADADDFTQSELDDLEADIEDSAPPSVAKHMPGFEEKADLKLKEEFRTPAASLANNAQTQSSPSMNPMQ
ncbi:MAG: hypothetical protein K0U74_13970 [Alphaproteobacteria bacterium]|nr:hypothetical protein [Alphaproteobacteria bacterium]